MHLLLVEDDDALVAELKPRLQSAGYAVEVAVDGEDAAFLGAEEDFELGASGRQVLQNHPGQVIFG